MITHISGGDDAFNAAAFGRPDMHIQNWCNQRTQQFQATLPPQAMEFFTVNTNQVFNTIDYSAVVNIAQGLEAMNNDGWSEQTIAPVYKLEDLQIAPIAMIPWIMANNQIQDMYQNQQIAGYDDYYGLEPERRWEAEHMEQAVRNGLFFEDPETGEETWRYTFDEYDPYCLTTIDKANIVGAWEAVLFHIGEGGEDPTSTNGTLL